MLLKIYCFFNHFSSVRRHVCSCVVLPPFLAMTPSTLGGSELYPCHCANLSATIWPVGLTNLYSSLEGVSLIQQISDQLLCDRKLGRYLCAALDYVRVTAVQIMGSIETVISPVIGSQWNITNESAECL